MRACYFTLLGPILSVLLCAVRDFGRHSTWMQRDFRSSLVQTWSTRSYCQCPLARLNLELDANLSLQESKTKLYKAVVQQLKSNVKSFSGAYGFLADYEYTLGADELTYFGQQQMVNSGVKFYQRYEALASKYTPFLRSAGQSRVVESAQNWTQGYHAAKSTDRRARSRGNDVYPYEILEIPENEGLNNTLNHEICTDFEEGWYGEIADAAQTEWASIFATPIRDRLNSELPGANLSTIQTVYLMDLCPFNTVASDTGAVSPFCSLFSEEEWHKYDYYEVTCNISDPQICF